MAMQYSAPSAGGGAPSSSRAAAAAAPPPPSGPEGPVPSLLSALREDNRSIVSSILRLGPCAAPRNFVPGMSSGSEGGSA
eukprot:CAMPEP_0113552400 /NCGR_PEP_ID=MMETSP0015_2-20120614/15047_1 /TAXON_ID=2838 /ORGANISM="Odontella" /LENGTH=79 /DNA_ID=CAMNT_0000453375 /DNA_START=174 /DNA_END=410 /DNA_ORIENTATION=+ /assembly_acc=CAM_ASM_000160